jgi:type II secretory pathway pseudopilin PulG
MRRVFSQRGDTLVEVTIAFAIVSTVISSSAILASTAVKLGNDARQRTEAAAIEQQVGELLRNDRDASIGQGSDNWTTAFENPLRGSQPLFPVCGGTPINVTIAPAPASAFSKGNTWTPVGSNVNSYPISFPATSTLYYTVQTNQWSYDTWVDACTLDNVPSANPQTLRFTVQIRWKSPSSGITQQSSLDTELVDIGNITGAAIAGTLNATETGVPSNPVAPTIITSRVYGSGSNHSSMYDAGQEVPRLQWTTTGADAHGCRVTGPGGRVTGLPNNETGSNYYQPSTPDNLDAGGANGGAGISLTYYLICTSTASGFAVDSPQAVISGTVYYCEQANPSNPIYPFVYGHFYGLVPDPTTGLRPLKVCPGYPL